MGALPNLIYLFIGNGYNGNIDYALKNAKRLSSLNITGEVEFSISSISTVLASLQLLNAGRVKGTIAEVAKIVNMKDWGQTINQSSIEGDLADVPANVFTSIYQIRCNLDKREKKFWKYSRHKLRTKY